MYEANHVSIVAATLEVVEQILDEMDLAMHSSDSILVDPDLIDGNGVLRSDQEFGSFISQFSIRMGCIPYGRARASELTVRQFCELYVSESYPKPPDTALGNDRYAASGAAPDHRDVFGAQGFPICFVLGCGRSGTTLFRSMLNRHAQLWAPGELHLAQFDTMGDRAEGVNPFLRHTLVPEVASRLGESPESFARRLAGWEQERLPVPEVYRRLHDADPTTQIVDKTPPYSGRLEHLRWITQHFDNATFVHLVRRPHDVIRSYVRMQLYKTDSILSATGMNPYQVGETMWFRHNANIAAILATVSDERSLVVRYEDLVTEPEPSLSLVCDLLGVAHDATMANPYADSSDEVARGAGDPRVNLLHEVERREPAPAFYPLGDRCSELASTYGY